MIKSFKHKGLEDFFKTGSKAGIQADHEKRLRTRLTVLNRIKNMQDLQAIGWNLHALDGDFIGFYSISVSGNWRIIFTLDNNKDVVLVDYLDYH